MADLKVRPTAVTELTDTVCRTLDSDKEVKRYVIALSGGIDSIVLTHILSTLQSQPELIAIHINHGLDKEADTWQAHCRTFCAELGVGFIAKSVVVTKTGKGLEAAAREQRYRALRQQLRTGDVLLTAHHQQDQAETLLLNLFRGSGVTGLAAMPIVKYSQQVQHIRPMLSVEKADIQSYAEHYNLAYINDPSNLDLTFTRNFIRHKLLPELRQRWTRLDVILSRTAENMGQAAELLVDLAQIDLKQIRGSDQRITLSLLNELSLPRQKNAVRYWMSTFGINPTQQQLTAVFEDCIQAAEHANPKVELAGYVFRRYRDCLYSLKKSQNNPPLQHYSWQLSHNLSLPELDLLLEPDTLLSSDLELSDEDEVEVRFRQGGEKFKADKQGLRKSLKNYFQEVGLPPWERDIVPLIYKDNELIAVWHNSSKKR